MNERAPQSGFTIVEIIVVVSVMLVIAMGLFSTMFTLSLSAKGDQIRVDVAYDKQVAITTIETDVQSANTFLAKRDTGIADPYEVFSTCGTNPAPSGCAGTWNAGGNGSACTANAPASYCSQGTQNAYNSTSNMRVLILREYATTVNPYDTNRLPVYVGVNGTSQCNAISKDNNPPLTYDLIYFVQNGTLYRRRLMNTTIPNDGSQTCGDTFNEKTSCPSVETLAAANYNGVSNPASVTRDSSCGADDEVVATNVSAFKYAVYSDCAGSSVTVFPGTGSSADTDPAINYARCVNVDMFITRPSGNDTIQGEAELRMSSLNARSLN